MPIVPDNFDSAYRLATVIASSGAVPKSFCDYDKHTQVSTVNVARVALAILHGLEVGLTPMAAIQSISVINGMPTIYGDGALGLVQASGLLEDIEETVEKDKDGTPLLGRCRVKRRDRKQWVEQEFTQAEAKRAGLWTKERSPWLTYPQRMLKMRARSWALRDAFPDVLRGLGIREEVEDMIDVTARGSHTMTAPPEPTRDQFRAKVTDADLDQDQQPTSQSSGAPGDASDGAASNSQTEPQSSEAGADDGWPLYDGAGETIGNYGVTEWLDQFEQLANGAMSPKDRRQYMHNNADSAKALVADPDVPEQIKAVLRKRFEAFLPVTAK
jgi:hypothetical protein